MQGPVTSPALPAAVLRRALDLAPEAVLIARADGQVTYVNQAACDLTGFTADELVGFSAARVLRLFSDPREAVERVRGIAPGEPLVGEWLIAGKQGVVVPIATSITAYTGADGAVDYYLAISVNLSTVKYADDISLLLTSIAEATPDALLACDLDGTVMWANLATERVLGWEPGELVGHLASWFAPVEDAAQQDDVLARIRRGEEVAPYVARRRRKDGTLIDVSITVAALRAASGEVLGVSAMVRDITGQLATERALQESEELHRTIVRNASDGMLAVRLDGSTLLANERLADIIGVPLQAIYDRGLLDLVTPDQRGPMWEKLQTRHVVGAERYEFPYAHPDGTERILSVSSTPLHTEEGGEIGVLATIADVTTVRRTEDRLRWQALHDPLTGLPNRVLLTDRLEMAAARQSRTEGAPMAVLFLDLDDFKLVNDTRGHVVGDLLLKAVAGRLQEAVRQSDTVARLGGDEFAVICEDADRDVALEVAERVRAALEEPVQLGGEHLPVATSIGIALAPPHPSMDLLQLADVAMYAAKSAGKNAIRVFDDSMIARADGKAALSEALQHALEEGRLRLDYRPMVNLVSHQVVGLQALPRWDDPLLAHISAEQIVEAAEWSGQCSALDRAVLSVACREFPPLSSQLGLHPTARVSVTVTAPALTSSLTRSVGRALERSGMSGANLMLEITEASALADPERSSITLPALRGMRCRISIDNFGGGYSSLNHLEGLSYDLLRLDGSFLRGLGSSPNAPEITRSIIALAHAMGLRTMAEGVDTPDQARAMRELGCVTGRGALWPPVT